MKLTLTVDTHSTVYYYAQALYEANHNDNETFEEYLADFITEVVFNSDAQCDEADAYIREHKQEIVAKHPAIIEDLNYIFED